MAASRTASGLAPAALLAGALGAVAALSAWLEGEGRVAAALRGFEFVRVALATAFVPLAFAALTASWLYLARTVQARALRGATHGRAAALRRIALSLPLLGVPGYAVLFLLTHGTSAFRPGRSEWQLALVVVLAAPLLLFVLELTQRVLLRWRGKSARATFGVLVACSLVAFAIWFVATASLRERYGASQVLSFGLLVTGATLLFGVFFAPDAAPAGSRDARAAALFGLGFVASASALLAPASPSVVAHFHAERPARWFARALAPLLPDADHDGSAQNLGVLRGGDCDDADPKRHPYARDVPGNGVDENCFQGDAVAQHDATTPRAATFRQADAPKNVVLVVIDSLRFDRRFENGVNPAVTPALARLAAASTAFSAFRTCSPRTRESVPDLLGAAPELSTTPATPNAIAALTRAGVQTAFIASEWLARYAAVPGFELTRLKPSRYGHFADAEVAASVRAFLRERRERPFFLFTHWLGAHEPYAGEPACLARAKTDRERYDCALALLDRELAALLESVTEAGLDPSTVLAVTADHGEEFEEHGGRFHATTLYDEILRVPLVIRAPGRHAQLTPAKAGCGDLLPTLLTLAGHQPGLTAYGHDALAETAPRPQLARTRRPGAALFEPHAHAVVHREHKLVFDAASGTLSYFDLARDPLEQKPLASVPPGVERELLQAMDNWLSAQGPARLPERTPVVAAR